MYVLCQVKVCQTAEVVEAVADNHNMAAHMAESTGSTSAEPNILELAGSDCSLAFLKFGLQSYSKGMTFFPKPMFIYSRSEYSVILTDLLTTHIR